MMDVALNIGAQLGDAARKETRPVVEGQTPSQRGGGRENANRPGGEGSEFQAAVSELSVITSDHAGEVTPASGDISAILQEPQIRISTPASNRKFHAVMSESPLIMSEDGGEVSAGSSDVSAILHESQIRIPIPASNHELHEATSELPLITLDDVGEVTPVSSDANPIPQEPQVRIFTPTSNREFHAAVSELSVITLDKTGEGAPILDDVSAVTHDPQHSNQTPVIVSNIISEQPQHLHQTAAGASTERGGLVVQGVGDLTNVKDTLGPKELPRAISLPGAKGSVSKDTPTTEATKRQPAPLNGPSQLVLPGVEEIAGEEIQVTEKQKPQISTLGDPSRATGARDGFTSLAANPAYQTSAPAITAITGETVSGDLDFDIVTELSASKRFVSQQAPMSQLLPSLTTSQATISSATVQIMAAIKATQRGEAIEVRLDPPEMGRVKIDFTMETPDAVRATLTAERGEILEHLRKNISDLEAQLKHAGFASIEFEFASNGENGFSAKSDASETSEQDDGDMSSRRDRDVVYLSMRSDAQLDLLA